MPAAKKRLNPKIGSEFEKKYKGKTYVLKVVRFEGDIAFHLNGENYSSPTAAGKSVTGSDVNGWRFWGID